MTLEELINGVRASRDAAQGRVTSLERELQGLRGAIDGPNPPSVDELRGRADALEAARAQVVALDERLAQLGRDLEREQAVNALQAQRGAGGAPSPADRAAGGRDVQPGTGARTSSGPTWVRSNDGRPATVERGQRFADHEVVRGMSSQMAGSDAAVIGQHGSLGQLVRAMSTTSGSAIVPSVWAGDLIDRARNASAVMQAGAEVVPMDAKVVQIGRLTGDPTAAFRAEGSTVTASDPTFDNVTLTATTMSTLVVGSLEWFQDADNVDQIVSDAIAKAMGLQIDLVSLYGSITSGAGSINLATPPNPRGVLGALNALASTSVLGAATNGTTQTALSFWNEILDLLFTVRDFNEEPNGIIWNSKAARMYAKTYDSQGQPLAVPADVAAVPRYVSNNVPSYTQGTMANVATDVFAGDWRQLLIGQRLGITIQTLTERYAELGQVGIVAHWRGDVQVARPRAFSVYKAIKGA